MGNALRNFISGRLKANELYQRPHDWSFVAMQYTAANRLIYCLSQGRVKLPVRMFLVQSDLNNGGVLNVGSGHVSLTNGIQLDPGRAIQFAVGSDDMQSTLFQTPVDWTERVQSMQGDLAKIAANIYLDMADFWLASDSDNQRVRIFWTTLTK